MTSQAGSPRRRRWLPVPVLVVLLLVANLAANPWFARYRSLAVMAGYDWSYQRDSLPADAGVRVDMPLAGSGLYPLMVTFNADEAMSNWLGQEVRFTVDFTFADFDPWQGHSAIFDPDDPRYGAYVGAYYLQGLGRASAAAEVAKVAEFDQRGFALPALGLGFDDSRFEILESTQQPVNFAGHDWNSHDALVRTNCPDHTPTGFRSSYLQFGTPPSTSRQYPECVLSARIEVTYLAEQDLSIGLYVMAASPAELDRLSEQVVRRSVLTVD